MTQCAAQRSRPAEVHSSIASNRPADRLIVAIDGPAGTGKSSVARQLAARLGLEFLDTGAMYRAATALAIDHGLDLADGAAVAELVRRADLHFDWTTDPPTLMAMGRSVTRRLRDSDVAASVSPVSGLPEVRRVLVERQRRIGEIHDRLVSEGRDQGSVVFYDAQVKIYLDASPRVRAERRAAQLKAMGREADVNQIEQELANRDHRDSTRAVGPLTCPDGAVRVDTSHLPQDAVVDELVRVVSSRISAPVATAG